MSRNFEIENFPSAINPAKNSSTTKKEYYSDTFYSQYLGPRSEISFICPQCGKRTSNKLLAYRGFDMNPLSQEELSALTPDKKLALFRKNADAKEYSIIVITTCQTCDKSSIWLESPSAEILLYPDSSSKVEAPSPDMPVDVAKIYQEASSIVERSPQAAAGLLRLATQKLVNTLVPGDGNLNKKIGSLVHQGLNPKIQEALDTLRVVGNNSVHPGEINLNDKPDTAYSLFKILNIIVQRITSDNKQIDSLYSILPDGSKKAIEQRDKKAD